LEKLPDQLQDQLRLVFVGTAAGQRSADTGHYYAGPGNRFWRTIHEVGITPHRYGPREFPALLKLGIGVTDLCKLGAGKAVALGRQPPQDDFPAVFVLASPSGAASGQWSVQPWRELADVIETMGTSS
jgi:TDG/mug DNA glycosylase family protein